VVTVAYGVVDIVVALATLLDVVAGLEDHSSVMMRHDHAQVVVAVVVFAGVALT
jgi:hypothetical protein